MQCKGQENSKNKLKALKYIVLANYIGFSVAAPIFGGVLIGKFLDEKFNTRFIFTIIFVVLGIAGAFTNFYVLTIKKPWKR